jgi:hypothetical protein
MMAASRAMMNEDGRVRVGGNSRHVWSGLAWAIAAAESDETCQRGDVDVGKELGLGCVAR